MVHKKMNDKLPPPEKRKPSKRAQEQEDEIRRNIQMENKSWNGCKFKIHLNKLE